MLGTVPSERTRNMMRSMDKLFSYFGSGMKLDSLFMDSGSFHSNPLPTHRGTSSDP